MITLFLCSFPQNRKYCHFCTIINKCDGQTKNLVQKHPHIFIHHYNKIHYILQMNKIDMLISEIDFPNKILKLKKKNDLKNPKKIQSSKF